MPCLQVVAESMKCLIDASEGSSKVDAPIRRDRGVLRNFQLAATAAPVSGGTTAPARSWARHGSLHMAKTARYCLSGSQGLNLPAWDPCYWARNLKPHEIPFVAHLEKFAPPAFCPTPQHERGRVREDGPSCKPPDTPKPGTCWVLNHGTRDACQEAQPLKAKQTDVGGAQPGSALPTPYP